jgi:branched-chain amino acid transport system substrate-binding protein
VSPRGALLFLSLALLSCDRPPSRVVIGVALTRGSRPAAELAAREINAAGGVAGVTLELMGLSASIDSILDPSEVIAWSNRFADRRDLVAVIGPSDSTATLSAAGILNQRKVPELVTVATHPAITSIGPYTFRLCISDATQAAGLARHAVSTWGKRRIAVFFAADDYGFALAQLFTARARELGAEVVASVGHRNIPEPEDEAMIRTELRRLSERTPPPDLVVLFSRVAAAEVAVREMRALGMPAAVLGGDSLSLPDFASRDPALKEGIRISTFLDPALSHERTRAFVERYRRELGSAPNYDQVFAYDAVMLVRDAVAARGFSRESVKSYLEDLVERGTTIEGAGGPFVLGADHDARRPFYIAELRGGAHQLVDTIRP